jgi:hypothetical protein
LPSSIWIDRDRAAKGSAGIAVLGMVVFLCFAAEGASCRGYPQEIRAAIKKHVEALRAVEREAADRLKGLDTRTFAYLADRARAVSGLIADKNALADEAGLDKCRTAAPPVRRLCANAAQALIGMLEEQAGAGGATASNKAYAETMAQCERWMNLVPLSTVFRIDG